MVVLAAVLILQEGGPLADELESLTNSAPAPDLVDWAGELADDVEYVDELLEHDDIRGWLEHSERVRSFLRSTLPWSAVEDELWLTEMG